VLAVERLETDWEREAYIFVVLAGRTGLARAAQFLLSAVSSPELARPVVTPPCLHFWIFFLGRRSCCFLKKLIPAPNAKIISERRTNPRTVAFYSERENNFGAEDDTTNRRVFFWRDASPCEPTCFSLQGFARPYFRSPDDEKSTPRISRHGNDARLFPTRLLLRR
jgi:hypothetical protein